jgi:ketosteroid isomerase-like protein
MSVQQDNLAVIVAWLDAMRRGDLRVTTDLFAPDIVWRGVAVQDFAARDDALRAANARAPRWA